MFFHSVDDLLVTAEVMQVPLTAHQVGLCFLNVWLSLTELSAFLAENGIQYIVVGHPALKLQMLDPNAVSESFTQLCEELKSFCTGEEWQYHVD